MAAADYLAAIHTRLTGCLSIAQTPLAFLRSEARFDHSSIWLISASGRNVDIRRAVRHAIASEPAHLAVMCAAIDSPIAKDVKSLSVDLLEFDRRAGKDGFLATNSLVSFLFLLSRAYSELVGVQFPKSIRHLINRGFQEPSVWDSLPEAVIPLLGRESWLVLFDPDCYAIAADIESRFSEAALGSIKLADLRNFAHGRHFWAAKYSDSTAALVLSQPASESLAYRTLELIPNTIPKAHIRLTGEKLLAPIAGVLASMEIAALVGKAKGIDPGRPGVPPFGSRLYNLSTSPVSKELPNRSLQIVKRKALHSLASLKASDFAGIWKSALTAFLKKLYGASIQGIVFDYDGTLVHVNERYSPPRSEIAAALVNLLSAGIKIGIATGRGKSARTDLQKAIPGNLWSHVLVGYHNGSEIGTLDDNHLPDASTATEPILQKCKEVLQSNDCLQDRLSIKAAKYQLSVRWKFPVLGWRLRDVVGPLLAPFISDGITIVSSGHSIDILVASATKTNVILQLADRIQVPVANILAIGDQGWHPGNDHELLAHMPSLSVDEVSPLLNTCWRLTPPMVKGPLGTLWYLSRLEPSGCSGSVSFRRGSLTE
jgi:haloacid dehalogenase-like hydrolase